MSILLNTVYEAIIMKNLLLVPLILLIFMINGSVLAHSTGAHAPTKKVFAVWQQHEEKFWYSSFDTYYSCDGLENKVEILLSELGARNVKARASGCFDLNGELSKTISVKVNFEALTADQDADGEATSASFQELHIRPRHPRGVGRGDCGLIDSIQRKLLGNFEHEVIKANRKCFPGEQSLSSVDWKLRVLKSAN